MLNKNYHFFQNTNIAHYAYDIYHYTSPKGFLGILESNSLHFTNIYFLNDKTEMIYTYKLILDLLPSLKDEINDELLNKIYERAEYVTSSEYYNSECEVLFREDFYIASFSTDNDSLSLWNNYTKTVDKTGFNFKFNAAILLENIQEQKVKNYVDASLVCYDKAKQERALIQCIKCYNELYNKEDKDKVIRDLFYEFIVYSLFFKHQKFEVEKEYRIIIGNTAHTEDINLNFRINNGMFIPYLQYLLPNDKNFENRIIEEIKISPISNQDLIKYSINKVLNKTRYEFLPITFSDIPLRY